MAEIEKGFIDYLKKVSPGMPLRTVINDLQRAGLGALIVFDSKELKEQNILEGGFRVNCLFTPQKLFELCKMDGAIVVSPDLKRIIYANVLLAPDNTINSNETGTRHKAAERTAKQTNTFVIALSERRKKTTLYYGKTKYVLKHLDELMRDVSSNLQLLEKQREIFSNQLSRLNLLEVSGYVSVSDVCKVIQRAEIILKISDSIKRKFTELGKEGNVMNMRYKELLKDIEKTEENILRDYSTTRLKRSKTLLANMTFDGLLDLKAVSMLVLEKDLEETAIPKGYRFLSYLNLTEKEISNLVKSFGNLNHLLSGNSNLKENLKKGIENLKEQVISQKLSY
ncbi:MAG: DNA integrity scanning diadenylate cyclase DisA [Candidatus Nanoarchaeia archaeon]